MKLNQVAEQINQAKTLTDLVGNDPQLVKAILKAESKLRHVNGTLEILTAERPLIGLALSAEDLAEEAMALARLMDELDRVARKALSAETYRLLSD